VLGICYSSSLLLAALDVLLNDKVALHDIKDWILAGTRSKRLLTDREVSLVVVAVVQYAHLRPTSRPGWVVGGVVLEGVVLEGAVLEGVVPA
jgi:hypothetical protein